MSEDQEFKKAARRLPPPIACFLDGAACPWCGCIHKTITFGENTCADCGKSYFFGYPDWHDGEDPLSFVTFPWKEWEAFGRNADFLPDWKPNDRLKHHYHQKAEEKTGIYASVSTPN